MKFVDHTLRIPAHARVVDVRRAENAFYRALYETLGKQVPSNEHPGFCANESRPYPWPTEAEVVDQ